MTDSSKDIAAGPGTAGQGRWVWLLAAALGACAFTATFTLSAGPAPLGAPLPRVVNKVTVFESGETSFYELKMPAHWLKLLAPQPDGLPPLYRTIDCARLDGRFEAPFGFSQVVFPDESFLKNSINFGAEIKFDQPLKEFRCSLPPRGDARIDNYVSQMIASIGENNGTMLNDPAVVDCGGYKFTLLEYDLEDEKGLRRHYVYVGPYGQYAAVLDFITRPFHAVLAKAQTEKCMASFQPGEIMLKAQRLELYGPDPDELPGDGTAAPAE